ncbi:MAG TPA: serine protease, partial [Desulfitobacterium dehalogenans]|nr:serine protease [Desulfitobacterium dehalogenans]
MRKTKKFAIGVSLVVLLAVAAAPVQAALKVRNSYSSSDSNGSFISLRSCIPWTNNTATTTPSTPSAPSYNDSNGSAQNVFTPVNTNPVNTSNRYGSVISLKDFKFAPKAEKPSNPTPVPTQPAQTKPAPTQPVPTQPATPPTTPPTSATTTVSTQEQLMINEINKERADAGLAPVKVDLRLVDVAQLKAQDMKTNGYFSHTSPTYGSPFDMLRNEGIQYRSAGENIAR